MCNIITASLLEHKRKLKTTRKVMTVKPMRVSVTCKEPNYLDFTVVGGNECAPTVGSSTI